jgi:hypothetical protein
MGIILAENAFDGGADEAALIVGWRNDGDDWNGHENQA